MSGPSISTVKRLFALSGNRCAFPDCRAALVDDAHVSGHICHIKAAKPGGKRFDPAQTDIERHGSGNLMLMCPKHHQMIDADANLFPVTMLAASKAAHEDRPPQAPHALDDYVARMLIQNLTVTISGNSGNVAIGSPGTRQEIHNVTIRSTKKKIEVLPPPGTIGADGLHAAYISSLIKKYNEYASKDERPGTKFNFGAISRTIENKLGAQWKLLPLSRANEVEAYLLGRIKRTRQGRMNEARGFRSAPALEEFAATYQPPAS